jgi:Flp pilus assembly protein TadB
MYLNLIMLCPKHPAETDSNNRLQPEMFEPGAEVVFRCVDIGQFYTVAVVVAVAVVAVVVVFVAVVVVVVAVAVAVAVVAWVRNLV